MCLQSRLSELEWRIRTDAGETVPAVFSSDFYSGSFQMFHTFRSGRTPLALTITGDYVLIRVGYSRMQSDVLSSLLLSIFPEFRRFRFLLFEMTAIASSTHQLHFSVIVRLIEGKIS